MGLDNSGRSHMYKCNTPYAQHIILLLTLAGLASPHINSCFGFYIHCEELIG